MTWLHLPVALVVAALFVGVIYRWRFFTSLPFRTHALALAFVLKISAGITLSIVYTHIYEDRRTGDTVRFFDDATILACSLEEKGVKTYLALLCGRPQWDEQAVPYYFQMTHWERNYTYGMPNDNSAVILYNALVMPITRGNYWVNQVVLCILSFIGLTALLKVFLRFSPARKWGAFAAVYLIPSVLFWNSGILKEALHSVFFGPFLFVLTQFYDGHYRKRYFIALLLTLPALLWIKAYVLLCALPALLSVALIHWRGGRNYRLIPGLLHLIPLAIFLIPKSGELALNYMRQKQIGFLNVASLSDAGSFIAIPPITEAGSYILHAPEAFLNALLRPMPGEATNAMQWASACENIFWLLLAFLALWFFRRPRIVSWPLVLTGLSLSILFLVLMGSIVPVLGALARYKVSVLPFLAIVLFTFTDTRKLRSRFPLLERWAEPLNRWGLKTP